MNRNTIFCFFAVIFCASCFFRQTEPSSSKLETNESPNTRQEKHESPPPPLAVKGKLLFPTIVHPNDQTAMVLINAEEKSRSVQPFYIDQYEITVKKFVAFNPRYDEKPHAGHRPCPNCPAMGIDWFSANQYCQWAGKRLPTETEWELAAQGPSGSPWPWGDRFLPRHANLEGDEDGYSLAAPVGSFPQGASSYGVLDMIGNVWEWVSNSTGTTDPKKVQRIIKGGGWTTPSQTIAISFRGAADPAMKTSAFGFRCAKSLN